MKRTAYRSRDAYAQVSWEMVAELDGDVALAVVFDWIAWKADPAYDGHTDDDGNVWFAASIPQLAATTHISEKVIRRALDELVKRGHLTATQLHLGGAYDRTKAYRPLWEDEKASAPQGGPSAPEGRSICPTGPISSAPQGRSHLPHRADLPLSETKQEPTNEEQMATVAAELTLIADDTPLEEPNPDFGYFWAIWPRKDGKKAALAAWTKAIKRAPSAVIVAAAHAYANSPWRPERQFVPHAATWLNGDRWDDPPPSAPEQRAPLPSGGPPRHPSVSNALALVEHFAAMEAHDEPHGDRSALGAGHSDRSSDAH